MVYAVFVIAAVLAFLAGMRTGLKLESDAFAELHRLRVALSKTNVRIETYLSGDVERIHAELGKVLHLPRALAEAIKATIRR